MRTRSRCCSSLQRVSRYTLTTGVFVLPTFESRVRRARRSTADSMRFMVLALLAAPHAPGGSRSLEAARQKALGHPCAQHPVLFHSLDVDDHDPSSRRLLGLIR